MVTYIQQKYFGQRNILVYSVFTGVLSNFRTEYNDPEIVNLLTTYDEIMSDLSKGVIPEDVMPSLQYVWESSKMKKLKQGYDQILVNFLAVKYQEHVKTFERGKIHNFAQRM